MPEDKVLRLMEDKAWRLRGDKAQKLLEDKGRRLQGNKARSLVEDKAWRLAGDKALRLVEDKAQRLGDKAWSPLRDKASGCGGTRAGGSWRTRQEAGRGQNHEAKA